LLVAAEGFSRQVKLPSTIEFITDSQPLFIPFGEQLWAPVMTLTGTTTRAFFLPEVCDLPLDLVWPTSIRFDDMHASVHALKGGYAHFLLILTTLQPTLSAWLNDVKDNPQKFSTPSVSFTEFHDVGFPDLDSTTIPPSITDLRAFSPMMEMAHGFVWRLTCDATGSQEAHTALAEYLTCGETAITSSLYHGAPIPGRWCPNFAYHFKVASDWPTRPSPLAELTKLHLVSERGQDYDPLTIDLYIPVHPPMALVIRDKKTTDVHRHRTPKYSDACIPEPHANHQLSYLVTYPWDSHHWHSPGIHRLPVVLIRTTRPTLT
jgi:hypothetical protein